MLCRDLTGKSFQPNKCPSALGTSIFHVSPTWQYFPCLSDVAIFRFQFTHMRDPSTHRCLWGIPKGSARFCEHCELLDCYYVGWWLKLHWSATLAVFSWEIFLCDDWLWQVKANPGPISGGRAPIYGAAGKMPDRGMVRELLVEFMDSTCWTGIGSYKPVSAILLWPVCSDIQVYSDETKERRGYTACILKWA